MKRQAQHKGISRTVVTGVVFLMTFFLVMAVDSSEQMKLEVKEFTLDNGLLFLVVERPTAPQVACRLAIRAGSALEESGQSGIAHLLEHMMFKGTKNFGTLDYQKDQELQDQIEAAYQVILQEQGKRNPDQTLIEAKKAEMDRLRIEVQKIFVPQAFSAQLGKNGGFFVNAYTNKDETQYMASVPSDMLEQWFSIISEQLFEPSWREFYVEKEVVQREWAYRYVNSSTGAAFLDLNAVAYLAHPYRNPTIGWRDDMTRYNTTAAMEFHRKNYAPANAVCVLVGDLTVEKARELADIYFKRYPAGQRSLDEVTKEPPQQGPRQSIRYLKGARTPLVRIGYQAARMGTDDFYALDALIMVLSYGRGARLTQNIVNKGLAVDAWAGNPDNRYGGMFMLGGSPNEPDFSQLTDINEATKQAMHLKTSQELEQLLIAEAEKLKTERVDERELERIKKLNLRDFLDSLRNNDRLAQRLASIEVQVGWSYLTTYIDRIAAITPDDIMRVAKTYIMDNNRTTVFVLPGGNPDEKPVEYVENRSVSGAEASKRTKPSSFDNHSLYPTPANWKHPLSFERVPQKIDYPDALTDTVNGATIYFLQDNELPLIDITLFVKAGSIDIADDKIGLTDILNRAITRGGTEKYSPEELAMQLDENAITLSFSSAEEATEIHISMMKQDWEKGLQLLQEIMFHSRFTPEVLDIAKQQTSVSLKRQGGEAERVAMREAKIRHFAGHLYGRDPLKALETLPDISAEDLTTFLQAYFIPKNMVVAVAGDMEFNEVQKGLKKFFGAFPKTQLAERVLPDPTEGKPVLALVHKPGQVQSQVIFTLETVKRTHPDYWNIAMLTNIFGGSDSFLYKRLRSDLGLVYAAYAYQNYMWQAGFLTGYIGCQADQTRQALSETARIMKNIQADVPEEELAKKKLDALNSFVFNVDTPRDLVDVYGRYKLRDEPIDTLERIQDAYLTVTKEKLEELARKYLVPEKLKIFVVVDKETPIKKSNGLTLTLEEDLKGLALELGLPFEEIPLR